MGRGFADRGLRRGRGLWIDDGGETRWAPCGKSPGSADPGYNGREQGTQVCAIKAPQFQRRSALSRTGMAVRRVGLILLG